MCGISCKCQDSQAILLEILASPHQLDLAPYASGSYNAQWNAPELLHGKHMLRLSRILRKMEVKEPWLGLWLPLNYGVDIRAR